MHVPSQHILARRLEVMKTPKARAVGLLKYKSPPESYAAVFHLPLFGFFPLVHTMGMNFPIDILFLNRDRRVISVHLNTKASRFVLPFRYVLGGARYLLELSTPSAKDVKVGDLLAWEEA